jgi:molybdopterin-containing oxidoreductase family iron-sulfur binding subunit
VLILAAKANPGTAGRYPFADYRAYLISRFPGGAPAFTRALQTGLAAGTLPTRTATRPAAATRRQVTGGLEGTQGDMYLMVYPSTNLGDGRGANKPWLQEIPDPVTKICWQTVAEMHPSTAKRLGVANGDHVTVTTSAGSLTLPVYAYLGIRPDTVAIALGRGHRARTNVVYDNKAGTPHYNGYGRYADGVGQNPLDILPVAEGATAGEFVLTSTKARVAKAGGRSELVTTEGSARQHGRGIGQAMLVSELRPGGLQNDQGAEAIGARGPTPESGTGRGGAEATGGTQQEPAGQGGEHGAGQTAGEHGAAGAEGGHHSFVGDASHEFLPGLRSPVANDAQGDFGDSTSKDKGMYSQNHWSKMASRRWAMTIDLARCTGCSACITACYAENNLPTVGAAWQVPQVAPDRTGFGANILRSREMSWIRLERYYEGAENAEAGLDPDFETRFVPMLCQHCGNAPCEPVCPVYATYHSPDGLNVQVYNRCVGTRYCSNNCPYKVRYFNWFGYGEPNRAQYAFPEPLNWQLNPDVTVRGKGVMEKCTFCVQRIREAESRADLENRTLEGDEFTTACAQACPSRAITFGDAADNDWTVASLAVDQRGYHVFEELNTYTAVVYLKKVNHPAPGVTPGPATT